MKTLIAITLSLMLTGCGWFDRTVVANVTGYGKVCVDGVTYLQFASGVTPKYTIDGKLVACR